MYKEIVQIKTFEEIEAILFKQANDNYFMDREIKSVEHKNTVKSLGARYLIKKSILDFLKIEDEFTNIEIQNEETGKPVVKYTGKVERKINEQKVSNIQISISHSRNFVTTLVIIE